MPPIPCWQVDAFTDRPFAGNPAAVCWLDRTKRGSTLCRVFFAPALGVNEDPVCGSAHCCLAPYWAGELGKNELMAYQASARGGVLRLRVAGDRVMLGGQAVTVWRGELFSSL